MVGHCSNFAPTNLDWRCKLMFFFVYLSHFAILGHFLNFWTYWSFQITTKPRHCVFKLKHVLQFFDIFGHVYPHGQVIFDFTIVPRVTKFCHFWDPGFYRFWDPDYWPTSQGSTRMANDFESKSFKTVVDQVLIYHMLMRCGLEPNSLTSRLFWSW